MLGFLGGSTGDGGSGILSSVITLYKTLLYTYYAFIIGAFVVLILFYFFAPKHCKKSINEWLLDIFLSLADEILDVFGIALVLDPGDWIAGLRIFVKYRKETGYFVAALCGLWAAGGFVSTWFPVGGKVISMAMNFIPFIPVMFCSFNKYKKAKKFVKKIIEYLPIADRFKLGIAGKAKKSADEAQELIAVHNPVAAVEKTKHIKDDIIQKLHDAINSSYADFRKIAESEDADARDQAQTIVDEVKKGPAEEQTALSPGVEKIIDDIENFEQHYNKLKDELDKLIKKMHSKKLNPDEYIRISELFSDLQQLETIFSDEFTRDEDQLLAA